MESYVADLSYVHFFVSRGSNVCLFFADRCSTSLSCRAWSVRATPTLPLWVGPPEDLPTTLLKMMTA